MKARLRKGFALVGLGTLVTIALGLYPRIAGRNRLRFPYLSGPIAAPTYQRLAGAPGWSGTKLSVAPGISLNGLVRRPVAASAPWLLYFPGNDATQLERGQAFLSRVRGDEDWGLAVFAYRGYDSSDGVPMIADLAADAPNIVLGLCKAENLTPNRVHVIGFSIGGYLAVRATGSLNVAKQPPASLTLMASVNDIVMVRESRWSRFDPGDDLLTQPFLGAVGAPVLVVQGGADETLGGPVQGKAIAETLGQRARYVELAGVGHNVLIQTETAIEEVHGFIASHGK